jgi:hypothetical protein
MKSKTHKSGPQPLLITKIYSITNPDNKCGGKAFMAINILIAIIMNLYPLCHTHAEDPDFKNKTGICIEYTKSAISV